MSELRLPLRPYECLAIAIRKAQRGLFMALVAAGLTWAAPAYADESAAAEALFRAGRDASRKGQHAQACKLFRESYRLEPAAGTLLNIATCEEELRQLASAWQHYRGVLDALPRTDDRAVLAAKRLAELDPRLPRVVIRKRRGAPADTVVRRGNAVLTEASFGVPLPIDPGEHDFVVEARGHEARTVTLRIAEGQKLELEVEPGEPIASGAKPASGRAPPDSSASGAPGTTVAAPVLLIAGATSLVVAAVTGVMAFSRLETVDSQCKESDCSREGVDAARQGRMLSTVAGYALSIGVAGTASGAYLFWSGSDRASGTTRARGLVPMVHVTTTF